VPPDLDVAAEVGAEGEREDHVVAVEQGSAEGVVAVREAGERRGGLVELVVGETPQLGGDRVDHVRHLAETHEHAPHERFVDLGHDVGEVLGGLVVVEGAERRRSGDRAELLRRRPDLGLEDAHRRIRP